MSIAYDVDIGLCIILCRLLEEQKREKIKQRIKQLQDAKNRVSIILQVCRSILFVLSTFRI